jgi:thiamine biosynthesis lipoprotein
MVVEGKTMGTTYRVLYFDEPRKRDFGDAIDSLLIEVNKDINTYDATSDISRFNESKTGIENTCGFLNDIIRRSKAIHKRSGGAFDPTVMPLVNAWGFGPEKGLVLPANKVDSLKGLIGFDKVKLSRRRIKKTNPLTQLDMGGIGQGYGADVIAKFLSSKGITDMLVELGGEGVALGTNLHKQQPWTIGILDPQSTRDHQFYKAYVRMTDQAFTTSGNYFNYKVVNGRKYGHTIDPASGYPVQHSLLSVSVFAPDCTTADGWATAFMVMGLDKAKSKLEELEKIDVIFMYSDDDGQVQTYISPGIKEQVTLE